MKNDHSLLLRASWLYKAN